MTVYAEPGPSEGHYDHNSQEWGRRLHRESVLANFVFQNSFALQRRNWENH